MSDTPQVADPFRPPTAALDPPADERTPFFTASRLKLIVMSILTFGIYDLFWFYWNWKAIRARNHSNVSPALRAIFSVLFSFACFSEIAEATERSQERSRTALALGFAYLLLNFSARLPDPYWVPSLFAFLPVLAANGWAREANLRVSPDLPENTSFSAWNWLAIVLGGLFLALSLVGLFAPTIER